MGITATVLKHSAIYSGFNALGKMVSLIMLPFYAHIFDTEGYGIIGMTDAVIGLLGMAIGSAMGNALMRVYHAHAGEEEIQNMVISAAVIMAWGSAICLVFLPALFSAPLSFALYDNADYGDLLVIALGAFVIQSGNAVCEQLFVIEKRSVLYSIVGLIRLFVAVGLNILLVIVLRIGVIGIFLSSLATSAIVGVIVHFFALRKRGLTWNSTAARELAATWLPLVPGNVVAYIGRQAERVFVRILIGIEAVGILEMAYKFPPLLVYFISKPFGQAWRTMSFEIAKDKNAPEMMGRIFTTMLFVLMFGGLLLFVNIDPLLKLLTPQSFWQASLITKIEICTTVAAAATYFFTFGLLYGGKVAKISTIQIAMTPAKIALSGTLIVFIGLSGAAISALVIQIATLAWVFREGQEQYRIPIEFRRIAALISVAAGLVWLVEIGGMVLAESLFRFLPCALYDCTSLSVNGVGTRAEASDVKQWSLFQLSRIVVNTLIAGLFGGMIFVARPDIRKEIRRFLQIS